MKTFSHCPACKAAMLNEVIVSHPGSVGRWRLGCLRIDHEILAYTKKGDDNILECLDIAIKMASNKKDRVYANWDFDKQELKITEGWFGPSFYEPNAVIPYFEPDLARYDELLRKLKLYLTFS